MPEVTVRKVENDRDFKSGDMKVFFEFPWTVYKNDPNWVPPLLSTRRKLLDRDKNPSWEYLEGEYYIAWRGETPVGSIAAFINHRHNEFWEEKIGWFGFFEVLEDQEAASALLEAASNYARSKGMTAVRGPASFTLNDECAMLTENFSRPILLMPYNPPYYPKLMEGSGLGFEKVMDLTSWYINPEMVAGKNLNEPPEKLVRVVEKNKLRRGIVVRKPDPRRLREELALLKTIYSSAWEKNWGFVPPTDREIDHLFAELKDFFMPRLARFAEVNGKPVAFLLAMPDMNQVLVRAYPRPGVPELVSLLKAAWHWKIRPAITGQRILLFGVVPEYRGIGVDAALVLDLLLELVHGPYWDTDCGWFLETNLPMLRLADTFRAKTYKRYRFYQRPLG